MSGSSVDDVHREIDQLMLAIFEAVRGHEAATDGPGGTAAKCQEIVDRYNGTLAAVDNLVGINRTKEEQEAEIRDLSEQGRIVRERIMKHEDNLVAQRATIDEKLKALYSDTQLGLSSPPPH